MTTFKKVLMVLLAVLMVASCFPASVLAHTFTDVTEYDDAISLLSEIEVIKGYSTTSFGPKDNVTRWQMALLISKIMSGDTATKTWESNQKTPFTDIDPNKHYPGSIIYASENKVVVGRGDGIFDPTAGITIQEGITMAIRALGLSSSAMDANYPDSYIQKANSLDLLNDVKYISYTQTMTRGQTAQLLYNMLFTERANGTTYAEKSFDISSKEEQLVTVVASESIRVDSGVAYARSGYVTVKAIQNDGTLGKSYSVKASTLGITNANSSVGLVYSVSVSDNEIKSGSAAASNTVTTGLTVNGTQGTITFGGATYSTVDEYTYTLKDGVAPSSKQIVVYGLNSEFSNPGIITAKQMVNTNAYFSLVTFDLNKDGYADRAVYTPYSFEQYNVNKYKGATVTGAAVKDGEYILGSYSKQTETLYVFKAFTPKEGKVTTNDATSMTIGGIKYLYGDENLPGAEPSTVKKGLSTAADSYRNTTVSYIAEGTTLLYVKAGNAAYTGSYVSQKPCAVVTADATMALNGYVSVKLAINNTVMEVYVSTINGALATSYYANLKQGDVVEYTIENNMYVLTEITSTPAVVTGSATSVTYDNYYIVLGGADKIPVMSSTYVYWYDGTTLNSYTATSSSFIGKTIPANYSVYVGYGMSGANFATFIYIRPTDSTVGSTTPSGSVYTDKLAVVAAKPSAPVAGSQIVSIPVYLEGSTSVSYLPVTTINNQAAGTAYATLNAGAVIKYSISGSSYVATSVTTPSATTGTSASYLRYNNGFLTYTNANGSAGTISVDANTVLIVYNGSTFSANKVSANTNITLSGGSSIYVTYGSQTGTAASVVYVTTVKSTGLPTGGTVTGTLNVTTSAIVQSVTPVSNYVTVKVYLPAGFSYDLPVSKINGSVSTLYYTQLKAGDLVSYAADTQNTGYYTLTKLSASSSTTSASGAFALANNSLTYTNSVGTLSSIAVNADTDVLYFNGTTFGWYTLNSQFSMSYSQQMQISVATGSPTSFIYIRPVSSTGSSTGTTTPTTPSASGTLAIVTSADATTIANGYITVTFQNLNDGSYITWPVSKIGGVAVTTQNVASIPAGTLVNYGVQPDGKYGITVRTQTYTTGAGTLAYNTQLGGLTFTNSSSQQVTIKNITFGTTKIFTYNSTTNSFDATVVYLGTTLTLGANQKIYVIDANTIYIK